MSKGTSPIHRFSGNYDGHGFYDADFTADISSKMQVPDRISATSDPRDLSAFKPREIMEQEKLIMNVPDRILLQGGDQHLEETDNLPELRLESSMNNQPYQGIQLTTPPNVITLDNHRFPTIEEDHEFLQRKNQSNRSMPVTIEAHNDDSMMNLSSSPPGFSNDDETILLRRQIRSLTRRVLLIERDNQQRQQREIVLYSASVVYFLFKGLFWLHRHW